MPYEYDERGFDMNGLNYEGKSREEVEEEDDDPHR